MRKKDKPLHERGRYKLVYDRRKDGTLRSPFIQIVWYDADAGRLRSRSTGTTDVGEAEQQLDALYSEKEHGRAICGHCGQPIQAAARHLVTAAIADYLVARVGRTSIDAIKARLSHVVTYLTETDELDTICENVDEDWIQEFRDWAILIPVEFANAAPRDRAPGTVEASVRQLAAVISFAHGQNDTLSAAKFSPKKPADVSRTPIYRADIETLAAMFNYCTNPVIKEGTSEKLRVRKVREREQLHRFLQVSVTTWARPDAAHDVSVDPKRAQWHPASRTLDLNPKGRVQTKKYRPIIPVARQAVPLLNGHQGFYVTVGSVRQAFEGMQAELKLPGDGESGIKLIRRSMAQLGRKRLGERDWVEGKMMLGHHRPDSSDVYAPFDPDYLARAREVTESIIDDIIALAPEAFHRTGTGDKQGPDG